MSKIEIEELISEEEIKTRIKQIAGDITADYSGKSLLFVGILKGSFIFLADLVRQAGVKTEIAFMALSSYADSSCSNGEVKLLYDSLESVEGKHLLVVDDIADTGVTLAFLTRVLSMRRPLSLKFCVLLDKPSRRKVEVALDYIGFQIPDEFVVGYGLDYAGDFRNLKGIYKALNI
ncbi:MAG: hypoxanthine phosphoribosyltransferase [Deferribacteraceae bacterium]|jgi:hypoxanthine phosphoribosyltransferase|nr:hypoxanthine phosphoribosyltransferase [Deferribacteraceae bacterium]